MTCGYCDGKCAGEGVDERGACGCPCHFVPCKTCGGEGQVRIKPDRKAVDLGKLPEGLRIAEGLKVISEHHPNAVHPNAVHLRDGVIAVCGVGSEEFNQMDIDLLETLGWLWNGVSCCWQWRESQNP